MGQTQSSTTKTPVTRQPISVRGCRVHNLRDVDVDIPRGELVVICGLSGSGKTSLALDTLYAEGQRSYIESFSAYTRQYLNQLDKPDCDSISGIPPAIAVTRASAVKTNRSTVATSTEIAEHLRLLFARASELVCYQCGQPVVIDSPQSVAAQFSDPAAKVQRAIVGFELWLPDRKAASEILLGLQQEGFMRLILKGETFQLSDEDRSKMAKRIGSKGVTATVVVDRLSSSSEMSRWTESLETAMTEGNGRAVVLFQSDAEDRFKGLPTQSIDGREMLQRVASDRHRCDHCDIEYPDPVPRAFNFNHPMGACPECEGFGDVIGIDMDRIVPDKSKSIREGAIAPWNAPSYQHELEELLALADDYDLPVDVPFSSLKKKHLKLIHEGVRERKFGGLNGFFAWLDRKKYKMHIRVFASRYRSYRTCMACGGDRLKPESLAYKVGGHNVSEMLAMRCDELDQFLSDWFGADAENATATDASTEGEIVGEKLIGYQTQAELLIADQQRRHTIASEPVRQIRDRLRYLDQVGLGYLQLNRTLRTLSGGETQRIALTLALGSTLVGMLYVLDEPTAGLHPIDVEQLVDAITQLRDRGNTVVAVEHNDTLIQLADRVIEIGPGAGVGGGLVTFEGTPKQLVKAKDSLTGRYLGKNRKRSIQRDLTDGRAPTGSLKLSGASGHNLKDIDVEFPLGCLTVVTGRSGSGKSSLIHDTLFGAVSTRLAERRGEVPSADIVANMLPFQSLRGENAIDDCLLVDQSPISRSPRSCPVTFAKAFDPIRQAFAETVDAKIRNFKPGHFSFNSSAGQCSACEGAGVQTIDMQFLADVSMRCGECRGRRYRDEVLQVRYRDRTIADVLEMTVREASEFFREMPKVQNKLKRLIDVGLDYVALGQPATTLSSGEAQRLKLAAFLAGSSKRRTLFLMDEPTTGLHFDDIRRLLKCFDALIDEGHSLVVIEHHPMLMAAADQIIEVGPGAAENGGQIVASGTRDEVASVNDSLTGQILRQML